MLSAFLCWFLLIKEKLSLTPCLHLLHSESSTVAAADVVLCLSALDLFSHSAAVHSERVLTVLTAHPLDAYEMELTIETWAIWAVSNSYGLFDVRH